MAGMKSWSTTPANNVLANTGFTMDEGMAPSSVNDSVRQLMADVRTEWSQGTTIVSATTTDLSAATGGYVVVSGTTTITGLGTCSAGIRRIVEFSGALTLTHNATSLILPGGANITTAAGDVAIFMSEGSGNWRCISYLSAATPAIAATQTQQETATSNAVFVTPGTQQYHPSAAKGWVAADAAGTIKASYNVTSITDGGVGLMTTTWNVDFSSADYAPFVSVSYATASMVVGFDSVAAGTCRAFAHSNTTDADTDPGRWFVAAFGDQ